MPINRIQFIPLIGIDTTLLTNEYTLLNTGGLPNACYQLRFTNTSLNTIIISFDGINDHLTLLSDDVFFLPTMYASIPNNKTALWPSGQFIYARSATADEGGLFISGIYLQE